MNDHLQQLPIPNSGSPLPMTHATQFFTRRAIDVKYGTNIVQDFWQNIMNGKFKSFP